MLFRSEKAILTKPSQFFTHEFLTQLDTYMQRQFLYNGAQEPVDIDAEEAEDE